MKRTKITKLTKETLDAISVTGVELTILSTLMKIEIDPKDIDKIDLNSSKVIGYVVGDLDVVDLLDSDRGEYEFVLKKNIKKAKKEQICLK